VSTPVDIRPARSTRVLLLVPKGQGRVLPLYATRRQTWTRAEPADSSNRQLILAERPSPCAAHKAPPPSAPQQDANEGLAARHRVPATRAYSCEVYACVLARGKSPTERRVLATEFGTKGRDHGRARRPSRGRPSIVLEAASARNGWKVILKRCAPHSKPRTALHQPLESLTTDRA